MADVVLDALGQDLVNTIEFEAAASRVIRAAGGMMIELMKRDELTPEERESILSFQDAIGKVSSARKALDIANRSEAAFSEYWKRIAREEAEKGLSHG